MENNTEKKELKVYDVRLDEKHIAVINHMVRVSQLQVSTLQMITMNTEVGKELLQEIELFIGHLNNSLLPQTGDGKTE